METMFLSFTAEITGGGLLGKTGANDSSARFPSFFSSSNQMNTSK
jgi:hypothetical protein